MCEREIRAGKAQLQRREQLMLKEEARKNALTGAVPNRKLKWVTTNPESDLNTLDNSEKLRNNNNSVKGATVNSGKGKRVNEEFMTNKGTNSKDDIINSGCSMPSLDIIDYKSKPAELLNSYNVYKLMEIDTGDKMEVNDQNNSFTIPKKTARLDTNRISKSNTIPTKNAFGLLRSDKEPSTSCS